MCSEYYGALLIETGNVRFLESIPSGIMLSMKDSQLALRLSLDQCSSCRFVSTEGTLSDTANRCSSCETQIDSLGSYPDLSALMLLSLIDHFYGIAQTQHEDGLSNLASRISAELGRSLSPKAVYQGWVRLNRRYSKDRSSETITDFLITYFRCDLDQAMKVLQIYSTSGFSSPELAVVPVLTVTLVETLLNDLLVHLCVLYQKTSFPDAHNQVRTLRSFDRRYNEFAHLTGNQFNQTVRKLSKPFWDAWVYIRRKRNYFVHGNPYALGWETCERSYKLAELSVGVFARLNNEFVVRKD